MGQPKPFADLGGRPLILWVLESLRPVCREIFIVADQVDPFSILGCRVVQDLIPGLGPMGGIYTALSSTTERQVFVTACDTPFLNPEVVQYLASQSSALGGSGGEGYEVVVARLADGFHPLQAVYARDCLPRLYEFLSAGRLSLIDFFQEARVRVVSGPEIEVLDPQGMSFFNINIPKDLAQANARIQWRKISTVQGGD